MNEDEGQWVSISDLMSGLMVIFLFVSVLLLMKEQNKNKKIKNIVKENINISKKINNALDDEFGDDFKRFGAERLLDGTIRFYHPKIMFLKGSYKVRERFKRILRNFCPRYVKLLSSKKFKEHIYEIKIVGHSSSEWSLFSSVKERSQKNTLLSGNRAVKVRSYCHQSLSSKFKRWFSSKFTITGASYVHTIKNYYDIEDKVLSRRVEFQIQTKEMSKLTRLINLIKE